MKPFRTLMFLLLILGASALLVLGQDVRFSFTPPLDQSETATIEWAVYALEPEAVVNFRDNNNDSYYDQLVISTLDGYVYVIPMYQNTGSGNGQGDITTYQLDAEQWAIAMSGLSERSLGQFITPTLAPTTIAPETFESIELCDAGEDGVEVYDGLVLTVSRVGRSAQTWEFRAIEGTYIAGRVVLTDGNNRTTDLAVFLIQDEDFEQVPWRYEQHSEGYFIYQLEGAGSCSGQ